VASAVNVSAFVEMSIVCRSILSPRLSDNAMDLRRGKGFVVSFLGAFLTGVLALAAGLPQGVAADVLTRIGLADGVTPEPAGSDPRNYGPARANYTATSYRVGDISDSAVPGQLTAVPGGYDIVAAGPDFGGLSDAYFFASLPRTGDFDLRVRVDGFGPGEVWAKAGLMARAGTDPAAPFVAVFGTPSNVGVGFMARAVAGAAAVQEGNFPVNYPQTWLRLRRVGSEWTGYASLNGREWARLGRATVDLGATVELGFAVASRHVDRTIEARFRELGPVTEVRELTGLPGIEPLQQSSRLTPVVFTEVMYHPVDAALEFVELGNPFATSEDLSGYRLSGEIDFVFPPGTLLAGGAHLVVARDPAALQQEYGITNVFGPYQGALSNGGGTLRLRHRTGAVFLEVEYGTDAPWPRAADGSGHSLVLARASYGEADARAWDVSDVRSGSPGRGESVGDEPLRGVKINEVLAHTDEPVLDFVELYNHGDEPLDLGGCWLTDSRTALTDGTGPNLFQIPPGTVIPPGGHVVFDQDELGFALSAAGETVYFANPSRTRVLDALGFEGQANGISTGRSPDGGDIYALQNPTPGAANARPLLREIVINEILYAPVSGNDDEEYLELHNWGTAAADIGGWRIEGGIEFEIPAGTTIPAGGYVVVARNRQHLLDRYGGVLTPANTVGNYAGALSNNGERLTLVQPELLVTTNALGEVETTTSWIVVDKVTYRDGGRWGQWSDGGGSSLEKVDPRADGRQPGSWADSDESSKAPWTTVSYSGRLDHGDVAADQLQVLLLGAGECVIDDVEVLDGSGQNVVANSAFDGGAAGWTAEGTQSGSGWSADGGHGDDGSCYVVRAAGRGDNQINRIRTQLTGALSAGTTATFRFKARWVRGFPEILLRLRGKWLETVVRMELPAQPGTPGQANSRRLANAGPSLHDVAHFPVLPEAGEAVVVTAQAQDPDGVTTVALRFRVDPDSTLQTVNMLDDGTNGDSVAGDGMYSGRIPAQAAGVIVAWHVQATDGHETAASSSYPAGAAARECLVRFGEPTLPGSIPAYRIWMTQATLDEWSARHKLDNTPSEVTFVLGNHRVIHQVQAGFAGSPYIAPGFNTPVGRRCGYSLEMPADDRFLGDADLVLDWPGGHGNENTAVQEQMAYWLADRMDLPYSLRHYIRLSVNGVTDMDRGGVFEAIIQPNRDFVRAWAPDDPDGELYKIDRAFEFSNSGSRTADPMPTLEVFETVGGVKKTARYRWNWLKRSYDSAIDFTNLFELVDAVNAAAPEPYTSWTTGLIEVEDWMGMFAFEHIINNFDSWGHDIGKNMYVYKPATGPWQLYAFDLDWLMLVAAQRYSASSGPLFVSQDPTVRRMYNHPPLRRAYFRAVQAALEPMAAENCDPVMDAKYQWLVDEGVTLCDGATLAAPGAVKQWFAQRHAFLRSQLTAVSANFEIDGPSSFVSDVTPVMLTGTAPVDVHTIRVNGAAFIPVWTSVNTFTLEVPLWLPGTNLLALVGHDPQGNPVPGATAELTIEYEGPPPPDWNRLVRINEWMAANDGVVLDPADADADDWIELFNPGAAPADLSGFHLSDDLSDVTRWRVPDGTVIPPGGYLMVWADGELAQNGAELHAGFQLSRDGESIGLFAPDGALIDSVAFGLQVDDLSQGRSPDGVGSIAFLTAPTPGGSNALPYLADEGGPRLEPNSIQVAAGEVRFGWLSVVGRVYQVFYTEDLAAPDWQPLGPARTGVLPIMQAVDPTAGGQRYYRLVEMEP
jgi:hypothetical protein